MHNGANAIGTVRHTHARWTNSVVLVILVACAVACARAQEPTSVPSNGDPFYKVESTLTALGDAHGFMRNGDVLYERGDFPNALAAYENAKKRFEALGSKQAVVAEQKMKAAVQALANNAAARRLAAARALVVKADQMVIDREFTNAFATYEMAKGVVAEVNVAGTGVAAAKLKEVRNLDGKLEEARQAAASDLSDRVISVQAEIDRAKVIDSRTVEGLRKKVLGMFAEYRTYVTHGWLDGRLEPQLASLLQAYSLKRLPVLKREVKSSGPVEEATINVFRVEVQQMKTALKEVPIQTSQKPQLRAAEKIQSLIVDIDLEIEKREKAAEAEAAKAATARPQAPRSPHRRGEGSP